jgi:hypothetical protein
MARRVAFTLPATTEISNRFSAGGSSLTNVGASTTGTVVASGVGTANTLKTLLTVNGSGYVPFLICYSNSATPAHTIRCKVFVDGVSVFDATTDTITTTVQRGIAVVDAVPSATSSVAPTGVPIRFSYSFVVLVASSPSWSTPTAASTSRRVARR